MSDEPAPLRAFQGYGIELEFMIVGRADLSVSSVADRLLQAAAGAPCPDISDVERGLLGWSNELVSHVIEVKNPQPVAALDMLPDAFQAEVRQINALLAPMDACLMPTAMHPWMDPRRETRLWPHHNKAIYAAYDRIFDSRSHGWANLQSMHINLPFADDDEFARLHAAIRLTLPILPALAASSPIADQRDTGYADYRMHVYCGNSDKVPSLAGLVIPETVSGRAEYEQAILAPMYRDIAPYDPDGVLQYEWLNSHGAIARFDRNAIEIRVVDTQECVSADLAIAAAAVSVVRMLYRAEPAALAAQQSISTEALARILHACIRDAEQALIDDARYLALLGYPASQCRAQQLWEHLLEPMLRDDAHARWKDPLTLILRQGSLARRIRRAVGGDCGRQQLERVYRELCCCLQEGRMFGG